MNSSLKLYKALEDEDAPMLESQVSIRTEKKTKQVETDWALLYFLCIGYSSIAFGRVALSVCGPTLRESGFLADGSDLDFGTMQGFATGSYCLGKVVWALTSDWMGGFTNMKVTMAGCTISGILCGFSRNNPWYFVCFWCLQMFFSSGVWGGVANVIRERYDESEYGRCFSLLGFFSRLGATLGALSMTPILRAFKWQYVFFAGFALPATLGAACIVKLQYMLKSTNTGVNTNDGSLDGALNPLAAPLVGKTEDEHFVTAATATTTAAAAALTGFAADVEKQAKQSPGAEDSPLWAFVCKCAYEPRVYAVLANSVVLTVIMELQFMVPVLLQEQFEVPAALGGYGAAFFIAGCMATPLVGAKYDIWSWKHRSKILPALVLFAAAMMTPLVLLPPIMESVSPEVTVVVVGVVLMCMTAGVCGPYYITGSEFACMIGGRKFAGFFLNSVDACSYIAAVCFDIGGYKYAAAHGWSAVILALLAALVMCAGVLMYYYRLPKLSTLKDL